MNREILFQGKSVKDGIWIDGFYVQHCRYIGGFAASDFKNMRAHYIMRDGNCPWGSEPPWVPTEVDPNTVRQFTGYCDLDSRRIFERDILRVSNDGDDGYSLLVVAFDKGKWVAQTYSEIDFMMEYGWSDKAKPIDFLALDDLCIFKNRCDCSVIGNIYDLPSKKTPEIKMEADL